MAESVLHVWESEDGWEIRSSDDEAALTLCDRRDAAIRWCEEHAEEIGASVVFLWERAALRPLAG